MLIGKYGEGGFGLARAWLGDSRNLGCWLGTVEGWADFVVESLIRVRLFGGGCTTNRRHVGGCPENLTTFEGYVDKEKKKKGRYRKVILPPQSPFRTSEAKSQDHKRIVQNGGEIVARRVDIKREPKECGRDALYM
jgi:hypothetical protein